MTRWKRFPLSSVTKCRTSTQSGPTSPISTHRNETMTADKRYCNNSTIPTDAQASTHRRSRRRAANTRRPGPGGAACGARVFRRARFPPASLGGGWGENCGRATRVHLCPSRHPPMANPSLYSTLYPTFHAVHKSVHNFSRGTQVCTQLFTVVIRPNTHTPQRTNKRAQTDTQPLQYTMKYYEIYNVLK